MSSPAPPVSVTEPPKPEAVKTLPPSPPVRTASSTPPRETGLPGEVVRADADRVKLTAAALTATRSPPPKPPLNVTGTQKIPRP